MFCIVSWACSSLLIVKKSLEIFCSSGSSIRKSRSRWRYLLIYDDFIVCILREWICAMKARHTRIYFDLILLRWQCFYPVCLLPPPWQELCFHHCPLVCLSVSLSVCMSVSNITENDWTDFHEIFKVGGTWYKEKSETFSGCSILPFEHRHFFSSFCGGIRAF